MNYRHAFHAGNFADVVKHLALVAVLLHLRKKKTAFAVIDTHAGRGLYDLKSDEATRTGEAAGGIGRLKDVRDAPIALATYLEIVRAAGPDRYPGSPLITARQLRPQDRLVAIEKEPQEALALEGALAPFHKARIIRGEGYLLLSSLLPPAERRGLVLIDPPYESETEFHDSARALTRAYQRFATGIFVVWFPTKSAAESDLFCDELLTSGIGRMVRLDADISPRAKTKEGLTSAGLVVINPPFGFDEEMRACFQILEPLLGFGDAKRAKLEVNLLAGE
jgi:23S rRNA (adenine2030-N6)-methyltransferase